MSRFYGLLLWEILIWRRRGFRLLLTTRLYHIGYAYVGGLKKEYAKNRVLNVLKAESQIGYNTAVSYLTAVNGDKIVGVARCKNFSFREISPRELAEELSVVDLAEKFQLYLDGAYHPPEFDEIQVWRERMSKWAARKE